MLFSSTSNSRSPIASFLLAGCLAALPLATFAGNAHQARLAKRQAAQEAQREAHELHLAHLADQYQAHHDAQLAAHDTRLAKQRAAHQAVHKTTLAAGADQHNAHLAKIQAAHQARQAAHETHVAQRQAAHQARIAKRQAARQTRQAHARQKMAGRMAKLHAQHIALTSGNVVEAAYAFRGTRYVMGGTSRSGFDCSGFVRYILGATGGVAVPRTAAEQYYNGAPIAPQDMQPGDLVFFKGTYKRGISHVGLYAGDGKFIHAANAHKGVRMDDLNSSYYLAHFAGARRVLPEQMRAAALLPQRP